MSKRKSGKVDIEELERTNQIKRLVVIAIFADDELMERLVLKGGNAIDLAYHAGSRASVDIDLSMEDDFSPGELEKVYARIEANLAKTFRPAGYEVFDVTMEEKPESVSSDLKGFWGGYNLSFKLIEAGQYAELSGDPDGLRRNAVRIGAKGKFEIDISKFEYCRGKAAQNLDGYRVFVYTPEMLVCEKLRALCQQMPEYGPVVHRTRTSAARARDFLDIYTLIEHFKLEMGTPENRALLRHIFEAKRVPVTLLDKLAEYREFHRPDFQSVKDTVKAGVALKEFDFYFDYVIHLWAGLKALGDI